jgi:hypothetical protein
MAKKTDDFFTAQTAEDKNRPTLEKNEPEIEEEESIPLEESKEVPSLYPKHDPEFNRPIFKRHKDSPPAAPSGSIIKKTATPARPTPIRSHASRREEVVNFSPMPLKKVETGIHSLDLRTGGLGVGTLSVLAGIDPSTRSHLAVFIANHVVQEGGRVLAMISPTEEGYWSPSQNLYVDIAVRRDLEGLIDSIDEFGKVDLVIVDPLHVIETPQGQDRVAAMDNALSKIGSFLRRKRTTLLAVSHFVDRASRHEGVSLHPWMFRDVSCLMDVSELILILRTQRSGLREILTYRRTINNRIGGLPSFVLPWV